MSYCYSPQVARVTALQTQPESEIGAGSSERAVGVRGQQRTRDGVRGEAERRKRGKGWEGREQRGLSPREYVQQSKARSLPSSALEGEPLGYGVGGPSDS